MTLTAPTYTIHCDEPDCRNSSTFLLTYTGVPGLYDRRAVEEVYAFYGGVTLPDGKHRCASCRGNAEIDIASHYEAIQRAPSSLTSLIDEADRRYLAKLQTDDAWRANQFNASDVAFLIRLLKGVAHA